MIRIKVFSILFCLVILLGCAQRKIVDSKGKELHFSDKVKVVDGFYKGSTGEILGNHGDKVIISHDGYTGKTYLYPDQLKKIKKDKKVE